MLSRDHRHRTSLRVTASRRAVLRACVAAASVLALGGCAALSETAPRFDAAELSANPTLLVATTRKPVNGARAKPWFGPERLQADHRARQAHAAGRGPLLARLGRAQRLAPQCHRDGAAGRRSARARDQHPRRAALRPRLQPDLRDGGARCRAALRRHPVPRRDHGVLLAVQGEALRLRLRPRERDVVARCPGAGARRAHRQPGESRASISSRTASAPC